MSSYNGQQHDTPNGRLSYPVPYPRHGVQVQIPRVSSSQLHQSNGSTVSISHQTRPVNDGYQHVPSMHTPSAEAQAGDFLHMAATSDYAQPIPGEPVHQVSEPPIDSHILLLSLAEEYFRAAYGKYSRSNSLERETDIGLYYKLISTGLGCLEVVLRVFLLSPL